MFGGRFSTTTGPIGIDFGTRAVKLLQVRETPGELQVVGAAQCVVQTDQASPEDDGREVLTELLRGAVASGGFVGRKCVVSIPRRAVRVQSVRLPKMSEPEVRQAAIWEAAQRFDLDRGAMQVDFIRTGATLNGAEGREEVLLVAASHADLKSRLEPVLAAGLRPIAVDADFCGLSRALSRQFRRESDQNYVRTVVDVGPSGSTVLVLRGDAIAFCKLIEIGGAHFDDAVAEHLQMDAAAANELRVARMSAWTSGGTDSLMDAATDRTVYDAVRPLMGDLVKEIVLCMRYYGVTFRGHPPIKIILSGGESLEPNLDRLLAQACKVPVVTEEDGVPLKRMLLDIRSRLNRTPGPPQSWAVALGLGLRGLTVTRAPRQGVTPARRGAA